MNTPTPEEPRIVYDEPHATALLGLAARLTPARPEREALRQILAVAVRGVRAGRGAAELREIANIAGAALAVAPAEEPR